MANETARLEEQLRRALEGEACHGPSVLEAVAGVPAEQAWGHPIPGVHSIWELVLHIGSDYALVLRRLAGDGRRHTPEEDWPSCPPPTDENWQRALAALRRLDQELRQAVLAFPVEALDELLVPESPHTAYTHFIGVTQHTLYHAGQISLLRRALAAS